MGSSQRSTDPKFDELWGDCARWLYSYLISLLHRPQDVEDVFQETCLACWQNFDRYQPNTEFRAWACRIAHFKALKFRQSQKKSPLTFSDLFIEAIDEEAVVMADRLDLRLAGLEECLAKLPPDDRELIGLRYRSDTAAAAIAAASGRSIHAVYRGLARIHEALRRCIDRTLRQEARP
jgi:RNA polymerase sigma-70 factor, ECF subfamily